MKGYQLSSLSAVGRGSRTAGHKWARRVRMICLLAIVMSSAHASAQTVRNITYIFDPNNSGQSIDQTPSNPVFDGDRLTCVLRGSAPEGCAFQGWVDNGQLLGAPNLTYVIPAVHEDHAIILQYYVAGANAPGPWTGGVIPFVFGSDVTAAHQAVALEEMRHWSFETGCKIAFVPWLGNATTPGQSIVKIVNQTSGGNVNDTDYVGKPPGVNPTTVAIGSWDQPNTVAHELGHVLGLRHAHQRPDRNSFIAVQWGNFTAAPTSVNPQYAVFRQADWMPGTFAVGEAYDVLSIMHYLPKENQFSAAVMVAKPGLANADIWNAPGYVPSIQFSDITHVRSAYGTNAESRYVDNTGTGGNQDGSISGPYRDINTAAVQNAARNDPGSRLWVAPGTYAYGATRISGPQKILPYPGGGPVRIVR